MKKTFYLASEKETYEFATDGNTVTITRRSPFMTFGIVSKVSISEGRDVYAKLLANGFYPW